MGTVFHSVWSDFGDFSMRFFNAGPCANPGAPLARTEALLLRLHCNASPTRSPPSVATRHLPPRGDELLLLQRGVSGLRRERGLAFRSIANPGAAQDRKSVV